MLDLPTLGLVIGSAAIDSINPCSIGVLILVISVILGSSDEKPIRRLLKLGATYIFAMFATYLIVGFGLVFFFSEIPIVLAHYLSLFVGVLVMLAGILAIKDYFWYGKGPSLTIPKRFADKIHAMSTGKKTYLSVMVLGAFVAAVELLCSGAPYLVIVTILRFDFDLWAYVLMVIYNLVFVAPLIIILLMVAAGTKISDISKWKEDSKGQMRLFTGLLMAILAWIIMLIANGTVNFG